MKTYPGIVRTRVTTRTNALLNHHAQRRGITAGELARDLLADGLERLEIDDKPPVWLELFARETFRTRAVVMTLIEAVGKEQGWSRDYLHRLMTSTRTNADEFAKQQLAEIETARRRAPAHKRV
jgi:hypothetical protein